MADEIEIIEPGDVIIQPISIDRCERCDDHDEGLAPTPPATKIVGLDIAQLGQSVTIGMYCDSCAADVAGELRAALAKEAHRG